MGHPVVHFEIMGTDGDKLKAYYSELFEWDINSDNSMGYGVIERDGNTTADGTGIGGGVGATPPGTDGFVTFYVEVPDIGATLAQAESLGGRRLFGPDEVMEGLVVGQIADPEGHVVGVIQAPPA